MENQSRISTRGRRNSPCSKTAIFPRSDAMFVGWWRLVAAGLICAFAAESDAATYYVSQNGSDSNSGLSWAAAWRSTSYAGQHVVAGDVVIIRKGPMPYDGFVVQSSGAADAPIVFRGEDPADPPVLSGATIENRWEPSSVAGVWQTATTARPNVVLEDDLPLKPSESVVLEPGSWYWIDNSLYYRPSRGVPADHEVLRSSRGRHQYRRQIVGRDRKHRLQSGR